MATGNVPSTPEILPVDIRNENRLRLRPWLQARLKNNDILGLEWIDKKKQTFKIPWSHGGKQDWNPEKGKIFKEWAVHTGKFVDGVDEENHAKWKTNLRCALHKAKDIQEMQGRPNDDHNPYRVYIFLPLKKKKEFPMKIPDGDYHSEALYQEGNGQVLPLFISNYSSSGSSGSYQSSLPSTGNRSSGSSQKCEKDKENILVCSQSPSQSGSVQSLQNQAHNSPMSAASSPYSQNMGSSVASVPSPYSQSQGGSSSGAPSPYSQGNTHATAESPYNQTNPITELGLDVIAEEQTFRLSDDTYNFLKTLGNNECVGSLPSDLLELPVENLYHNQQPQIQSTQVPDQLNFDQQENATTLLNYALEKAASSHNAAANIPNTMNSLCQFNSPSTQVNAGTYGMFADSQLPGSNPYPLASDLHEIENTDKFVGGSSSTPNAIYHVGGNMQSVSDPLPVYSPSNPTTSPDTETGYERHQETNSVEMISIPESEAKPHQYPKFSTTGLNTHRCNVLIGHEMFVELVYMNNIVKKWHVDDGNGCRLFFRIIPMEKEKQLPEQFRDCLYGAHYDKRQLLEMPQWPSDFGKERTVTKARDVLCNAERGITLECEDGNIFITRYCKTSIFSNSGSAPKVPREEPARKVLLFDYDKNFSTLFENYKDTRQSRPSPDVCLYFGQTGKEAENVLVMVRITCCKALNELVTDAEDWNRSSSIHVSHADQFDNIGDLIHSQLSLSKKSDL